MTTSKNETPTMLFDEHGDRIFGPIADNDYIEHSRRTRNKNCFFADEKCFKRYEKYLMKGLGIKSPKAVTADSLINYMRARLWLWRYGPQFLTHQHVIRAINLWTQLKKDAFCRYILAGPHYVGVLPKIDICGGSLGWVIYNVILPVVARSYRRQGLLLPWRRFRVKAKENDNFGITPESRYEYFLERLNEEQGAVWLYFPEALNGCNLVKAQEQMAVLPKGFVLAGALDIGAILALYPNVLMDKKMKPTHCCAANIKDGLSYRFTLSGRSLEFDNVILKGLGIGTAGLIYIG